MLRDEGWLHEFQKWHKTATKKTNRVVQKRSKPEVGWVKCNFDGALSQSGLRPERGWGWGSVA